MDMRLCISSAGILAACLAAAALVAQQPPAADPSQSTQNPPPAGAQKPARAPAGTGGNPFPEDITTVPVMPSAGTAAQPEPAANDSEGRVLLPAQDADPARSPDDAEAAAPSQPGNESSSSVPDMDRLQPKDTEDTKRKGKGKDGPEFQETAKSDIDVGDFELQRKNWKAALSRFQSAMILDPENPDVFWGMAEAARHLGDFASAKSYYLRVVDYDPESRHGKEAQKALKDPEIANAQNAASGQRAPQPQK
jgi:tetratricopeptide (TPR) repeat protein